MTFLWPCNTMSSVWLSQKRIRLKGLAFISWILWGSFYGPEETSSYFDHQRGCQQMLFAAAQLALCVFHRKNRQRVRWLQSLLTRAFTQRHVPFGDTSSIGAMSNTHLYTLVSAFTHFRREQRERERETRHARHSSYVWSVCGYCLVQSLLFRQVLIYLG